MSSTDGPTGLSAPQWFELQRAGNTFTAYVSADGTTWTQVGSVSVTMSNTIDVGMAVCSGQTNELDISTFDNVTAPGWSSPPPPAPTGLTAAAGDGQVALEWNPVSSAASYDVKRSTTNGGTYVTITNITGVAFTNTGLADGTVYYFVVTATNSIGESADSAQVSAQPISLTPPQLSFSTSGDQIQFTWPTTNTGWTLQAQTNALGTNWVTVPDSETTNQMSISINITNACVFFRLVSP